MTHSVVNGVNLNVEVNGSGPAIVALHGFTGDMSTWESFVEEAASRYMVVRVDLLGHGRSDSPGEASRYTIEHHVEDIGVILDILGISNAAWLGYSMGGRVALAAGAKMPGRCACLVLEGASPGITDPGDRAARARSDEEIALFIEQQGVEAFVALWERQPLFASQANLAAETRSGLRAQRLRNRPVGLANTLRAAGTGVQDALHRRLPSIQLPVLCVVGQQDAKFRAVSEEMCRALPRGRLAAIPGAGHCAHLEQPQLFNRVVLGFLNEVMETGLD